MEEDNAFYVVRKGDIVGVYNSFSECQHQLSSSVFDPAVSVYKGYSLSEETEEYLASHGLKNAVYSINSRDLKVDLFATLVPCPIQQPDVNSPSTQKRLKDKDAIRSDEMTDPLTKHLKLSELVKEQPLFCSGCQALVFSSLMVLRKEILEKLVLELFSDLKMELWYNQYWTVCRLREGLGTATNNVAEYRALILGMKYALKKGFRNIRIQGDSLLVCNQVGKEERCSKVSMCGGMLGKEEAMRIMEVYRGKNGGMEELEDIVVSFEGIDSIGVRELLKKVQDIWQTKKENLIDLYKEAKELKTKFDTFRICAVARENNSDADREANHAVHLPSGQVYDSSAAE
ncbi:hypothetical protein Taro_003634 [Colocasia esculenta]|uniref:RNase H type-1 domain-containing protein n=1 Tax=Colocasia esculenta TaxID=4460 RepID=A0A843TJX7_COLES|nr:hypothetical protein [Colocasia esculenta]